MSNSLNDMDLSILVNSCDKYDDLWYPFFELMNIYWPDVKYPIYLNTETKSYENKHDTFQVNAINYPQKATWSQRLLHALKSIPSEFVLFLMDDYFLLNKVNEEEIGDIVNWMKQDRNIANVVLYPVGSLGKVSEKNPRYILLDKVYPNLLVCCTAAIWRKEILEKLIRQSESPWEYEENGSLRAYKSRWDFYSLEPDMAREKGLVYPFRLGPVHGIGVLGGKWNFNNKKLFEEHGIKADFSKRETWKDFEEIEKTMAEMANNGDPEPSGFRVFLHTITPDPFIRLIRRVKSRLQAKG